MCRSIQMEKESVNPIIKQFKYGEHTITLETGRVARQAAGSVIASMNDTVVLAAVTFAKTAKPGQDFFPLAVHYQEKAYAAGRIPGGFFKREARPSEKETLTSRLIDRPIRPLFPEGFKNEVQVVITVLSAEKQTDPDIIAMLGTSAALAISGVPFNGPIGGARVGYDADNGYILNPTYSQLADSALDMVVAGTRDAVLMVESEAKELSEDQMLGAVLYAHQEMQVAIEAISELAKEVNTARFEVEADEVNVELTTALESQFGAALGEAYRLTDKMERYAAVGTVRDEAMATLVTIDNGVDAGEVKDLFKALEKSIVRGRILNGEPRIDGRDNRTVRGIDVEIGVLPKAHGSALFTRGETQSLGVITLGSSRDAQIIDALEGSRKDNFMLHYNFPPYSVGECGRIGFTSRREVGHGRLARRGIAATLPSVEDFPYTIRMVSEITESNGSSSMASVCSASLAMMDAGVPLTAPVAGIAMGLVKDGDRFAVLTDILGDEDHLGDMDFKVAGTAAGITALQMDIKIEGINANIMEVALDQAQVARLEILSEMARVISSSRSVVSDNAPSMTMVKVDSDKIRDVIGKGGAMIRSITEASGADIDIEDDGTVRIFAPDGDAMRIAREMVESVTAEAEVGKIYTGKVNKIVDFGAFVNILPGKDGLVHISQIAEERVENIGDYLTEGQDVQVKVLDVDNRGRIKLTMKEMGGAEAVPVAEPAPTAE